jgi:hypothetical protein
MGATMNHVVVARYKEDISWLNHVNRAENLVTVYEKFDVPEDKYIRLTEDYGYRKHAINHVMLPNVGNEAYTYLHHIVHMYYYSKLNSHDVDSRIFFVKGNALEYCPDVLDYINGLKKSEDDFQTMNQFDITTDLVNDGHDSMVVQFSATHKAIISRPLYFWKKLLRMSEDATTMSFILEELRHELLSHEVNALH